MDIQRIRSAHERRGAALIVTLLFLLVFAILAASYVTTSLSGGTQQRSLRESVCARYVTEAGLAQAYFDIRHGRSGNVGLPSAPEEYGGASHYVEAENLGMRVYRLVGTGFDSGTSDRIELVVREIPDGFFRFAAFGDEGVRLNANSFVDSYDSELGLYATQYDNKSGHATEFGNVGSNQDIELLTNTQIWGSAIPGPGHTVIRNAPNTFVSGLTQAAEELVLLPPIVVPPIPTAGNLTLASGSLTLPPGDHHYSSVNVESGATLTIQGPANVVLDDFVLNSNTTLEIDTSGGPVEIFSTGTVDLRGNSHLLTNNVRPHDLQWNISTDTRASRPPKSVTFNANSEYTGIIYAPLADVKIEAGFQLFGSVMSRYVELASNSKIHYDTSLLFDDDNGPPEHETVSWRPLAKPKP